MPPGPGRTRIRARTHGTLLHLTRSLRAFRPIAGTVDMCQHSGRGRRFRLPTVGSTQISQVCRGGPPCLSPRPRPPSGTRSTPDWDIRSCRRLRRPLHSRLCSSGAGCAAVGRVHRGHPAAADTFLRGARRLLAVPRRQGQQSQRRPDQLRLSPYRALPADVGHRRRRAANRPDQVVFPVITPDDCTGEHHGRRGTTTESESKSVIRDIAAKLPPRSSAATPTTRTPGSVGRRAPGRPVSDPPKPAERPAAVGPPRGPPDPLPGILEPPLDGGATNRRSSGGGTQAAGAQRPLATSNPPTRPVAHAATPGRRAIPTCAPSRHGKCVETRMAGAGLRAAGQSQQPLRSLRQHFNPVRAPYEPYEPTSRRAVAPRQMGRTAPARRTTRSRRSATAGQPRGTNVETSTARSPAPSAVVARAHHVATGTRLKTGIRSRHLAS